MTLNEIDNELRRLPASPTTGEDIEARAALMLKRYEVEAAAREAERCREAAELKKTWAFPLVVVPDGVDCVQLPNNRFVYVDIVDGKRCMQLTPADVRRLSIENQKWTQLNVELMPAYS